MLERWIDFWALVFAPSFERYARRALAVMRAHGLTVHWDESERSIRSDRGSFFLGNLFDDLRVAPSWRRPWILRRHARVLVAPLPVPLSLEEALPRLMPRVNDRVFVDSATDDAGEPVVAYEPLTEHCVVCVVVDGEDAVEYVAQEHLTRWGRSFTKLLAVARSNLVGRTPDAPFEAVGPGVFRSRVFDDFDDARMLLSPALRALPVLGDPVVCAVNRLNLLVTGADDPAGLSLLLELSERLLETESRPSHGRLLRLRGTVLEELDADLHPALRLRHRLATARDYASQKQLLESRLEREGLDLFVPTVNLRRRDDVSPWELDASWFEGVDSLLPRVDRVILGTGMGTEAQRLIGAPWTALEPLIGTLLEPTELYPVRYRTRAFPTAEQLDTLLLQGATVLSEGKLAE